jgi:hypothetical protein
MVLIKLEGQSVFLDRVFALSTVGFIFIVAITVEKVGLELFIE